MSQRLIVTRHAAAEEYIRLHIPHFFHAPISETVSRQDVANKHIAGNVPLSFAADAASVTSVLFETNPPRGGEYTLQDMYDAGVYHATFMVSQIHSACASPTIFYISGICGTVLEVQLEGRLQAFDSVTNPEDTEGIEAFFVAHPEIQFSAAPLATTRPLETYRKYVQEGIWE